MSHFEPDPAHEGSNPPKGVVKGTLQAAPGTWVVQFVVVSSSTPFAGPVETTVDASGDGPVSAGIEKCKGSAPPSGLQAAWLVAQYRVKTDSDFTEDAARSYNYRC